MAVAMQVAAALQMHLELFVLYDMPLLVVSLFAYVTLVWVNLIFFCILKESTDFCNKQFPERLKQLLKETILQLVSKGNLEVKVLTENGSEIRDFFSFFFYSPPDSLSSEDSLEFTLDDDMDYDLVTRLYFLIQLFCLVKCIVARIFFGNLKFLISNIPQLSRRKYDFDTVP